MPEAGWLARSLKQASDAVAAMSPSMRATYRDHGHNIQYTVEDTLYQFEKTRRQIENDFWLKAYCEYMNVFANDGLTDEVRDTLLINSLKKTTDIANEQLQKREKTL